MKDVATIILFTIQLMTSCGFSRDKATDKERKQTNEKNIISTSGNREIYHLLIISYPEYGTVKSELQAFYTDGSVINYSGNLTEASIKNINEILPDRIYYKETNGKLFCYSNNEELLNERNLLKRSEIIEIAGSWARYDWAMINGKWLIRPDGMKIDKNFKDIPGMEALGLVSVLLDGCCSYKKIEISSTGWYQLSYLPKEKEFEIVPVNLSIEEFYWDCGDMNMYTVSSDAGNAVLLFNGLKTNIGRVNSHFHKITCVVPGDDYSFSFNGVNYILRAEGVLSPDHYTIEKGYELSEDGRKETGNVYQEYKLYLESGGINQLILAIDNFSDRYVKIEFVGDLDRDGKPDFIFETATWYEDYEKMLFLSSFADEGDLVKYAGRDGYSMAC